MFSLYKYEFKLLGIISFQIAEMVSLQATMCIIKAIFIAECDGMSAVPAFRGIREDQLFQNSLGYTVPSLCKKR